MIASAGSVLSAMSKGSENITEQIIKTASKGKKSKVSLIKTPERASGIQRAVDLLGINPVKGKNLLLKPNFNTADPFPGSTHNDTLINLILHFTTVPTLI